MCVVNSCTGSNINGAKQLLITIGVAKTSLPSPGFAAETAYLAQSADKRVNAFICKSFKRIDMAYRMLAIETDIDESLC